MTSVVCFIAFNSSIFMPAVDFAHDCHGERKSCFCLDQMNQIKVIIDVRSPYVFQYPFPRGLVLPPSVQLSVAATISDVTKNDFLSIHSSALREGTLYFFARSKATQGSFTSTTQQACCPHHLSAYPLAFRLFKLSRVPLSSEF